MIIIIINIIFINVIILLAQVGSMGSGLLFFHHIFEFTLIWGYQTDV